MAVLFDPLDAETLSRIRSGLLRIAPAEVRALRSMIEGGTRHEIAARLALSMRTVETQLNAVMRICDCTRIELVRAVYQIGEDAEFNRHMAAQVMRRRANAKG